jgi:hypothetical protein
MATICAHDYIGNAIIVNGVALAGHVTVGKYAVIGGLAAIHQFIHIGDHADDFWWIFGTKRCSTIYKSKTFVLC